MAVGFAVSCLAMSFPVFLVPCTVKGLRYDNICLGFFFFFLISLKCLPLRVNYTIKVGHILHLVHRYTPRQDVSLNHINWKQRHV